MTKQKAHIVTLDSTGRISGLDELNLALGRGWTFVNATPMGGSTPSGADNGCLAALVILQREDRTAEAVLESIEEEADELLDDLVEGDGANTDVDIDPDA